MNRRTHSFGENFSATLIDRFGIWLSTRQIRKILKSSDCNSVADVGCGYEANLLPVLLSSVEQITLVDISVNPDCGENPNVVVYNGYLPEILSSVRDDSIDLIIMNSVLEHLDEPVSTVRELHRVLSPNGVLFINVPSWIGKRALEFSAFRLGLSPREEMEDHRRYYNNQQLWLEIRKAGFSPSLIKVKRHKFGLNVYCIATKNT